MELFDKQLVKFRFTVSTNEGVNIFHVKLHNHNYWLCHQKTGKQNGYCSCFIPLFNEYCGNGSIYKLLTAWKMTFWGRLTSNNTHNNFTGEGVFMRAQNHQKDHQKKCQLQVINGNQIVK